MMMSGTAAVAAAVVGANEARESVASTGFDMKKK
jgi:hypothetical protein